MSSTKGYDTYVWDATRPVQQVPVWVWHAIRISTVHGKFEVPVTHKRLTTLTELEDGMILVKIPEGVFVLNQSLYSALTTHTAT